MYLRVVCQPPTGTPREIRVSHLPALLGRGDQSDVRVPDMWVSRRHCRIEERCGTPVVRDLGSMHGTWVNDERVQEAEIHPGDKLSIGLTTLTAAQGRWWDANGIGSSALLVGHFVAAVLGLALGYYILCWMRPADFNLWNLPVPNHASAVLEPVLAAPRDLPP
jgi:predicted component of type VI protein secretion system